MHCAQNTLKFPGFLGILALAQTVCTRLSFRMRKEDNKNRALKESQVVMTRNNDFHGVKCLSGEFCC